MKSNLSNIKKNRGKSVEDQNELADLNEAADKNETQQAVIRKEILQVKNLSCGYSADNLLLHGINFEVKSGEMVSILGTNGSGKTTLLKTISNSILPLGGDVLLKGKSIQNISLKSLATELSVVMQFQEAAHMTVQEFVLLGRLPYFQKFQFFETRKDLLLVEKFLNMTNTLKLKDMPFNQISGGEKQLVAIARALVQEPSLLLLDEPTSHLDIFHQAQILNLIHHMKKKLGLAVLIVIHDLNLACEYSDNIVLLDGEKGRVHACGKPKEVMTEAAIKTVYGTDVIIRHHPVSGRPFIFIEKQEESL